uniref:Heat shock protein n=1 Tax=Eimeria tenella TaxID=5802 RepID=C5IFU1_EIMTE|nr:heat shock protein [Eimeria tenella]
MSDQYVKQRAFPDKALDLLDESCSWKRVSHNKKINVPNKQIAQLKKNKLPEEEEELKKLQEELAALEALTAGGRRLVLETNDVAHILSQWTGIPMGKMTEDEVSRVLRLADILSLRVVGQDRAVKAVADALAIQRAGLSPKNKPLGTFLFLGSSGVGKTELAKAVAEEMFDSEKNLIRLDMVEYQEAHSISRLIGPPPGYMGNDEGGQLTEAVRQKPHSVVLFDEVENAHKNLWSLLLPMLDEGHLSDSKGNRVDFTNCLIILTSNIGQQYILDSYKEVRALTAGNEKDKASSNGSSSSNGEEPGKSSFKGTGKSPKDILRRMRQKVLKEVFGYFKPQVIGRMSEIIIFEPLGETAMKGVLNLKLSALRNSLAAKGIDFKVADSALGYILERAWSHKFGGRRMAKYLEKYIKPRVAPLLISGKLKAGDRAVLARSNTNPNQLNLIVCELNEEGVCKPGTKYGTKLVTQEVKPQDGNEDEEDAMD